MTSWFAYFKDKLPHSELFVRLLAARDTHTAVLIANELAVRDKMEFLGVITAPSLFNGGK